jgi:hypothetical protein
MRGKVITRTPFERQATVLSLSEQEYYQSKSRARDEPVGEQVEFTPVASEPARSERFFVGWVACGVKPTAGRRS